MVHATIYIPRGSLTGAGSGDSPRDPTPFVCPFSSPRQRRRGLIKVRSKDYRPICHGHRPSQRSVCPKELSSCQRRSLDAFLSLLTKNDDEIRSSPPTAKSEEISLSCALIQRAFSADRPRDLQRTLSFPGCARPWNVRRIQNADRGPY